MRREEPAINRNDFNRALAEAARDMAEEGGTQQTLDRAVRMATDILPTCHLAGVSVVHADRIDTPVASHERLREADELQFELRQGPCFDALRQEEVVSSTDLAEDARWPDWGPHISTRLGVHAVMSFRLFTTGQSLGALNLYSLESHAFDNDDLLDGVFLAAHVAVALAATLEVDQLHQALVTRSMIGEAIGVLRERFGLSSDQAFGVLRRVSSQQNMKLREVARQLTVTGRLPDEGQRDLTP